MYNINMNTNILNILQTNEKLYNQKIKLINFNEKVVPQKDKILNAFNLIESEVKIVILGQDPYYVPGFANGLAFSVNKECKIPRSLQNIFKELKNEYQDFEYNSGDLAPWSKQGVLLLNTCLTTIEGSALAHKHVKWEEYTIKLIEDISKLGNIVFILLGNNAIKFSKYICKTSNNEILTTSHPSPLSANKGFIGSNIFKKANQILIQNNIEPINWNLSKGV